MDEDEDYFDNYDYCYECGAYGDDYEFDENGEMIWMCPECPFNPDRDFEDE